MNKTFKRSYVCALIMFAVFWLINGVLYALQGTKTLEWLYSDRYSLLEIPGATIIGIFSLGFIAIVLAFAAITFIIAIINGGLIFGGLSWVAAMFLLVILFNKIDFILEAIVDNELLVSLVWILLTHAFFLFVAFGDKEESSESCEAAAV